MTGVGRYGYRGDMELVTCGAACGVAFFFLFIHTQGVAGSMYTPASFEICSVETCDRRCSARSERWLVMAYRTDTAACNVDRRSFGYYILTRDNATARRKWGRAGAHTASSDARRNEGWPLACTYVSCQALTRKGSLLRVTPYHAPSQRSLVPGQPRSSSNFSYRHPVLRSP